MNKSIVAKVALAITYTVLLYIIYDRYLEWSRVIQHSAHEADIAGIIMRRFFDQTIWQVREGSASLAPYFPFMIVGMWTAYLLQKFVLIRHEFYGVWTTFPFMLLATLYSYIAVTINMIASAENWYNNPCAVVVNNYCVPMPGTFDQLTHFNAGLIIGFPLAMINFYGIYRLSGRKGRIGEVTIILILAIILSFQWEIVESLRPDLYTNVYGNSSQDMFHQTLGTAFVLLLQNVLVPFEREEYEEAHLG